MFRLCRTICVLLASAGILAAAESRFGLPVANLEKPKQFRFIDLTGNKFAMAEKNGVVVAAVAYGGPDRYYVDVAVSNRGTKPIALSDDFVRFHKNGSAIPMRNTL